MNKPKLHIVSLSGGKDSTAMLLRMLEEGMPVDMILYCDTGMEFPGMYEHLDRLENYIGMKIVWLKARYTFLYMFGEHEPKRKNSALSEYKGYSWPGPRSRWCTSRMKTDVINAYIKQLKKDFEIEQYIGIAADEPSRIKEFHYPLVAWDMSEADCLRYCKERGFDWGGLYDVFKRVSCWCCPLQSLEELRKLRKYYPELWSELRSMDDSTWRNFRSDYSVRQLEKRFDFEEAWLKNHKSIKTKAFFTALNQALKEESL